MYDYPALTKIGLQNLQTDSIRMYEAAMKTPVPDGWRFGPEIMHLTRESTWRWQVVQHIVYTGIGV